MSDKFDGMEFIVNVDENSVMHKKIDVESPEEEIEVIIDDDNTEKKDPDKHVSNESSSVSDKKDDEEEDTDYKPKTKKRIEQLIKKNQEAIQEKQRLENELHQMRQHYVNLDNQRVMSEQSALVQRKEALTITQKALAQQVKDSLDLGQHAEFIEVSNTLSKVNNELNNIDHFEKHPHLYQSQRQNFQDQQLQNQQQMQNQYQQNLQNQQLQNQDPRRRLSNPTDNPKDVATLQADFDKIYSTLPDGDKKWLDRRMNLFNFTTKEGQQVAAAVLGVAGRVSEELGGDHPDYHRELDNRLKRYGLLKEQQEEQRQRVNQPVMTGSNQSNSQTSMRRTVKLTPTEASLAREMYLESGKAKSEKEAHIMYVQAKSRYESQLRR